MSPSRPVRPPRAADCPGWYTCPTCGLRLWYANPCRGVTCVSCILSDRGTTAMVWSDEEPADLTATPER